MIKVNYDPQTTLVKGYYPDSINYVSIPEPFVEIEDDVQDNSKQMCVVNGLYKEYTPTTEEKKTTKKALLIAPRLTYLQKTDWFIAKEFDEPNSYPQEVKDKRILARQEINAIEACTTLTALNEFSIDF
jgi:hypothetical protein